MSVMMECGHAANAVNGAGEPSCAICALIRPGASVVAKTPPDLTGRTARCGCRCGSKQPSSPKLAFFEHRPNEQTDLYYCGCMGWD